MLDNVKEIHIEPTSLCNASCPMCARNVNGKELNPYIRMKSLDLGWFKNNISTKDIKKLDKIYFCGTVGDPAATPELLEIIEYLKINKPSLVIGLNTNGGLKTTEWWKQLGQLLNGKLDYCVFSIDGLNDTNHLYRVNVRWQKLMDNAMAYIGTGASAHWDMLIFKHNKHQVKQAKDIAYKMGFNWFRTKETDRWDIYKDTDLEPVTEPKTLVFDTEIDCERNREKSIFLDYTGKFWPCCHMAEAYLNLIGNELHKDLHQFGRNQLLTEYQNRLDQKDPFYVCKRSCGLITNKRQQWKSETQLK